MGAGVTRCAKEKNRTSNGGESSRRQPSPGLWRELRQQPVSRPQPTHRHIVLSVCFLTRNKSGTPVPPPYHLCNDYSSLPTIADETRLAHQDFRNPGLHRATTAAGAAKDASRERQAVHLSMHAAGSPGLVHTPIVSLKSPTGCQLLYIYLFTGRNLVYLSTAVHLSNVPQPRDSWASGSPGYSNTTPIPNATPVPTASMILHTALSIFRKKTTRL